MFPAAATLFAVIDSTITLTFLDRSPPQEAADRLSVKRLATWLRSVHYSGHSDPAVLHTSILAAPRGAT